MRNPALDKAGVACVSAIGSVRKRQRELPRRGWRAWTVRPRRSMNVSSKIVRPSPAILTTDSTSVTLVPCAVPAAHAGRARVRRPPRQVRARDRRRSRPPGSAPAPLRPAPRPGHVANQRLQNAVRRDDQAERPVANGSARMSPRTRPGRVGSRRVAQSLRAMRASALERSMPMTKTSGFVSSFPGKRNPRSSADTSRAAPQLEHRPRCGRDYAPPERDVALPDRARVFPVVERRVLVPALGPICTAGCVLTS